jgi:hypothetical protein
MLHLNEKRLRADIALLTVEHRGCDAILLSDLWEIIEDLVCKAQCDNEARYDSGYCSIHDMQLNGNKGARLDPPEMPQARCRVCRSTEKEPGEFEKYGGHCVMCISQG